MEIKFRAKNKKYQTWSFGSYVDGSVPFIVTNDSCNGQITIEECIECAGLAADQAIEDEEADE